MTETTTHKHAVGQARLMIFDTRGWFADGGAGGYSRGYLTSDHQHVAYIEYGKRPGKPPRTDGWKRWRLAS